ncbi:MAG: PAS domain-containing sensor histidine kinase [Anaerolineae bacterium]|nr:PAS domain-containing sensor histidine kinase [Anaerolineae bacterium]
MKVLHWLPKPPVFPDADRARTAKLLHYILLVTVLANLVSMATDLLVLGQPLWWSTLNAAILLLQIAAWMLNHGGRVKAAAFLLCAFCWAGVTVSAYTINGMFNSLFAFYNVTIVMAALLIGSRATIVFTGLSLLSGLYFVAASEGGIYPNEVGLMSASETFFNYAITFILSAVLLTFAIRALNAALRRAEQNERALQQSESKYRSVVQTAPSSILTIDRNHCITFLSRSIYGDPNQHIGQSIYEFVQPDWRDTLRKEIDHVLQTGDSGSLELQVINVTGGAAWYTDHIAPLWDGDQIVGATIIASDTNDRKQAEQAQIEAERLRLELVKEREVVEMKENFISTLSHDFRTPLAIILSAKESLHWYHDRLTPDRRLEHLHNIDQQVHYINHLLDDVLTIGKARAGKLAFAPEPMDLMTFCKEMVGQVQAIDKDQHEFIFSSRGDLSNVSADPQLLQHILINLLTNAAKYSPPGTYIEIKLSREAESVLIEVTDQGMGIPESEQPHLFEPFFRAHNARKIKGTGLGLAIVRESVVAHGGTIDCTSREGVGTTFRLHLPLEVAFFLNGVHSQ